MLQFDKNGFLVPTGLISSSLAEFKETFVDAFGTDKRALLFENYSKYTAKLKYVLGSEELKQWVNGSFVTKSPNPGDIDLISFISIDDDQRLGDQLRDFKAPRASEVFGVDAYLLITYPLDHANRFYQISDEAYWMDLFEKSRRKDRMGKAMSKGFLEIIS